MKNIHNFANRQLCEYNSIFPNVASLLDHLLFTIGNGYEFDDLIGLPYYQSRKDGRSIAGYPRMTPVQWEKLIKTCHDKECGWDNQHGNMFDDLDSESKIVDAAPEEEKAGIIAELAEWRKKDKECREKRLADRLASYHPRSVTDADFTEEALYKQITELGSTFGDHYGSREYFIRPYPLSKDYAKIYKLNENTPKWFIQIGLNLCKAWVRFLTEEIAADHVWKKLPKKVIDSTTDKLVEDIINEVIGDTLVDTTKDYPEPEVDYADLTFTTKHRDMLADLVQRLSALMVLQHEQA
jgi:hypothetical protein